ncbi:MAG: M50 family metallopeptidase [Gammaproteobacteria bacterium]|nr:M50 family metallopeptidase [Gammaproteobacteria bacterium]
MPIAPPKNDSPSHASSHWPALLLAAGLSLALLLLPRYLPAAGLLALPLRWLATLFHELGHGLAALALGGQFEQLALHANGSGVAWHRGAYGSGALALIAAAGPLGPPLGALALFRAARGPRTAPAALWCLALLMVAALLLWVRTAFGLVFVASLSALFLALAWRGSARLAQVVLAFLAIQMSLASFANADYLFTESAATGSGPMPSDTAQIALALGFSAGFWGLVLAGVSLLILGLGLRWVAAPRR